MEATRAVQESPIQIFPMAPRLRQRSLEGATLSNLTKNTEPKGVGTNQSPTNGRCERTVNPVAHISRALNASQELEAVVSVSCFTTRKEDAGTGLSLGGCHIMSHNISKEDCVLYLQNHSLTPRLYTMKQMSPSALYMFIPIVLSTKYIHR